MTTGNDSVGATAILGRATAAVVGLGSIGGIIAATLRAADRHDVIACVRSPVEHLTESGR